MIPTCEPCITPDDWGAVTSALCAGHAAVGPEVEAFEAAVAVATGLPHAVATSSGSAALIVALEAIGVRQKMRVKVPTLTFAAAAEAILHAGGEPEFVDHGAEAFLAVNFYGHPPAHAGTVQDACEGLGSSPLGGAITCLSFNGNKIITAGQGGMVLTRDAGLAARVRQLIDHDGKDATWAHAGVGWNFRMPAMNAALGLSQLARLEAHVASKRQTAWHYEAGLPAGATLHLQPGWHGSNWWMPLILLDRPARPVIDTLLGQGIGARAVWTPLHRLPPYARYRADKTPVADDLHLRGILLPCSVGITPEERETVLAALRAALDRGTPRSTPAS